MGFHSLTLPPIKNLKLGITIFNSVCFPVIKFDTHLCGILHHFLPYLSLV